jgi:hypothetical protein
MANPNPTPHLENLRPPWQPGTSGNPAGYSRGRRISDAIEQRMDELQLDGKFADVAIAMAIGDRQMLKHKATDPETGEDIWVEYEPSIAWFKMVQERLEPPAGKPNNMAVLEALAALDDDEDFPPPMEKCMAAECPLKPWGESWKGNQNVESAGTLCQCDPASVAGGQAAVEVPQALSRAGDLERFHPARYVVQLMAFLEAQLAGLFTGGRLRGALAQTAVVAALLLVHQAVVHDHQRAGGHVVPQGTVAADEHQAPEVQVMGRLAFDQLPCDPVAVEVAARHAGAQPRIVSIRPRFPELFPVLAPERPPDGWAWFNAG